MIIKLTKYTNILHKTYHIISNNYIFIFICKIARLQNARYHAFYFL